MGEADAMRSASNVHISLIKRYSSSRRHFLVRNSIMAARPSKNSDLLRHVLSSVYASATLCGSRVFQPSSAARTFLMASRVNGGTGG